MAVGLSSSDWIGIGAVLTTMAGIAIAQVQWSRAQRRRENMVLEEKRERERATYDAKREREIAALQADFRERIDDLEGRMTREHGAVTIQLNDMVKTIGENFVPRQEYNAGMRMITDAVNATRIELGGQMQNVVSRVDKVYDRMPEPRSTP